MVGEPDGTTAPRTARRAAERRSRGASDWWGSGLGYWAVTPVQLVVETRAPDESG